jgi:UDP-GlcNAc:undecaprenyl-phosphate GlcNAc-1-phosphate transferase
MAVGILAALLVMHLLGVVDDRRRLGTALKLVVEATVATVLVTVFEIRIFEFLGNFEPWGTIACVVASTVWLIAITNAMNMLDNMDGLAGGVGAVIAFTYLSATLVGGQWFVAALCAVLGGALCGFLVFNFPPARLFMGDGGSLVVGLLLAVISMRTTYIAMPTTEAPAVWYGALMPLLVMAVPLYDLASVVLIRVWRRRSPFSADQSHLSHRLVHRGLSRRAAVLLIWLAAAVTGAAGVMLARLANAS